MPSEFDLIARHFTHPTRHTVLGVGDDGALIVPRAGMELVISCDMLVAGTHFLPDTDPTDLGWKTLAVNVSDLAAMGATPCWATLALALPAADEAWLAAFAQGFFSCAEAFDVDLIGGDTTRGPLNLCVTIFGEVPAGQALRRSNAQVGDEIWVSGTPGLAALGLAHLQGRCQLSAPQACIAALQRPQPRVLLGLALHGLAHAAIDVSDGLLADLGHILQQSACAARLELGRFPDAARQQGAPEDLAQACMLGGGDDYELLFTAPAARHDEILALAQALPLTLSMIGHVEAGPAGAITLLDAGRAIGLPARGYDHFTR